MLAMSVTAAFAQYPTPTAYGVSCTVSGDTVTCAVVGAESNEQLTATATCDGTVVYEETISADGDGEAVFSFTAASAADCDVSVLGDASGAASARVTLTQAGDDGQALDTGATGTGTLPFTGSEVAIFLAVGLALVALGTFAVRRRGAGA
jgi:LPXTG-motif cell wall-anchored protein